MGNSIKYSEGSESLALNKGNWWIGTGDTNKGPTAESGYWNAINPPSGGYMVYLNKETNGPSIHSISNDEHLISFTNKISGNNYVNVAECLVYYQTQDDKLCVNREYENIVTDGLVLNLDAGHASSYPTSGTTWYDLSGNGNNGTLINGSTYNNNTILLDGSDDSIITSSVNTLGNLGNHAFEIWVKTSGLGISQSEGGLICPDYGMISTINSNGNVRYSIYNTDNGPPSNGGYFLGYITATGVNIFDNNWHHIICTCQLNGSLYIYIDGELQTSGGNVGSWSGKTIWSTMPISIGRNPNNSPYNFYGDIASAKIYTKYFTSSEVLQNYNATKGRFGIQ